MLVKSGLKKTKITVWNSSLAVFYLLEFSLWEINYWLAEMESVIKMQYCSNPKYTVYLISSWTKILKKRQVARSVGGRGNHVARMRTKVCTKFQQYSFFSNRGRAFCVLYVTWCMLLLGIMERRSTIKFCAKLQKLFTETFAMIRTAYGDDALFCTTVHTWF